MKRVAIFSLLLFAGLGLASASAPAWAAYTTLRIFVSSTGSDLNDCITIATACRTLDGALQKAQPGGEIDLVDTLADNARFSALRIDKAITIDGGAGHVTLIARVYGNNGFDIVAPPNAVVVLRNLTLNGMRQQTDSPPYASGVNGIKFTSGGALHLENLRILGFTSVGVAFEPTNVAKLQINNSIITDNGDAGILVKPSAGGNASVTLVGVTSSRNKYGLFVQNLASAVVQDSTINDNTTAGIFTFAGAAGRTSVERSVVARNSGAGVLARGPQATVVLSETAIFSNVTGISAIDGGKVISFGNNRINGNTTNGAPTSTVSQQ